MTTRWRGAGDDGAAAVEFVMLAVVIMVPFVYAVLCLFHVQRAVYALNAAAREGGRAYVTADEGSAADARAAAAARMVLSDHGLDSDVTPRITCDADPCLSPGGQVVVTTALRVPLPLVPGWGGGAPASVRVEARHVEVVDDFREQRP